jgi:L-ascorbate metabolism protein UlaG (beta-lactamase superfamily)
MDVPVIAQETEAEVYGSENCFNLLLALGLPPARLHPVHVGDRLCLGEFTVEVFSAQHPNTPIDRYINGPLPEELEPPLHLFDYRMDECFSFRIQLDETTILHGVHPSPAQILFASPFRRNQMENQLAAIQPALVVPIHWDDFFRPLSKPIRPMYHLPRFLLKPFGMIDLEDFEHIVVSKLPGAKFLVPEIFQTYEIGLF